MPYVTPKEIDALSKDLMDTIRNRGIPYHVAAIAILRASTMDDPYLQGMCEAAIGVLETIVATQLEDESGCG